MSSSKINLYIFSAVPTPHNNYLFKAVIDSNSFNVKLYYAYKNVGYYNGEENSFSELSKYSSVLGKHKINLSLIIKILFDKNGYPFFIHWPSNTSRILIIILSIFRKKFCFWTDLFEEKDDYSLIIKSLRYLLYELVKKNANPIFLVGNHAIEFYKKKDFPPNRLVNLPIFLELPTIEQINAPKQKAVLQNKLKLPSNSVIFSAGSRLVKSKGYDLLIEAVSVFKEKVKNANFSLIIVGKGEEESNLKILVNKYNLNKEIRFLNWLPINEFNEIIINSRAFIHPARFDAFGGGTLLAMSYGIPVIGSTGAGAVIERVINSKNGYIYKADDIEGLASLIEKAYSNQLLMKELGCEARKTAERWTADVGVNILKTELKLRGK